MTLPQVYRQARRDGFTNIKTADGVKELRRWVINFSISTGNDWHYRPERPALVLDDGRLPYASVFPLS